MTPDEHRQAFLAFVAGLIGDFDRYLARDDADPVRDGGSYNVAGMWLDDTELIEFGRELLTVLQPCFANPPRPGRKRRILATVLLPSDDSTPADRHPARPRTRQRKHPPLNRPQDRNLSHDTRRHHPQPGSPCRSANSMSTRQPIRA